MFDSSPRLALPGLTFQVSSGESSIVARCPDLDIIVTGSTKEQAEEQLKAAVIYQINQW